MVIQGCIEVFIYLYLRTPRNYNPSARSCGPGRTADAVVIKSTVAARFLGAARFGTVAEPPFRIVPPPLRQLHARLQVPAAQQQRQQRHRRRVPAVERELGEPAAREEMWIVE